MYLLQFALGDATNALLQKSEESYCYLLTAQFGEALQYIMCI